MDLRRRFANLPKESDVREPDGRSGHGRELCPCINGGKTQQRGGGGRPNDDERTGESSSGALGKDSGEAVGGNLCSESLTTSADAYLYLSGDKETIRLRPRASVWEYPSRA